MPVCANEKHIHGRGSTLLNPRSSSRKTGWAAPGLARRGGDEVKDKIKNWWKEFQDRLDKGHYNQSSGLEEPPKPCPPRRQKEIAVFLANVLAVAAIGRPGLLVLRRLESGWIRKPAV
jgi:hypothetical protein